MVVALATVAAWVKEPDPRTKGRRIARGARVRWLPTSGRFRVVVQRSPDQQKMSMQVSIVPTLRTSDVGPMMVAYPVESSDTDVTWKPVEMNRLSCFVANLDESKGSFDVVMVLAPISKTLKDAKRRFVGKKVRRGFQLRVYTFQ